MIDHKNPVLDAELLFNFDRCCTEGHGRSGKEFLAEKSIQESGLATFGSAKYTHPLLGLGTAQVADLPGSMGEGLELLDAPLRERCLAAGQFLGLAHWERKPLDR